MSIFRITNEQIVNGKIPDELLRTIPAEVTSFDFSGCDKLTQLPEPLPEGLENLNLYRCSNLAELPNLPLGLRSLYLSGCSVLATLPDLPLGLKKLDLSGCWDLNTLPNLPLGLEVLNLSGCSSLTELPNLPSGLIELNLSGCNQLSPASIAKLEALEEANQHNPRFRIIWPQGLSRNDKLLDKLKDAYRQYHSTNPDFVGREPNIFDQINYPTLFLFHRFTSESLGTRGKREVIASALSVAQDIYNNPKILEILDKKSSNYLTACVNQPVCGFAEIATLIDISKQDNITAKIQKAKILRVQQLIKNNIRFLRNQSDQTVGVGVEVELGNAILREVHKKLLSEEIISQPWQGIPGNISFEPTIESFLTKENIEEMFNIAQNALAETPKCEKDTIDFLCGIETDFWANTILTKEELEADNERIEKLRAKILEIDPSEYHLITKIQQEIDAIQRVKSANLVTTLQQKTKDLLREQDSSKVRASISPSPIEPEITLTTSQENDSAGGVFNERSKLKQSLYNRLKLRSNGIELSGDVVILTQENSEEPHRELNQQPSPFVNTTSGLTESQAQPITKQNHHYKD